MGRVTSDLVQLERPVSHQPHLIRHGEAETDPSGGLLADRVKVLDAGGVKVEDGSRRRRADALGG